MLNAYVGVASKQGLSMFHPERDDTRSLVRNSVLPDTRRIGFWAVLTDSEAQWIHALLMNGQGREAMMLLDRCAREIGRILSSDPAQSSLH